MNNYFLNVVSNPVVNPTLIKNFETLSKIVKSFENHESVLRVNAANFDETKVTGFSKIFGRKLKPKT